MRSVLLLFSAFALSAQLPKVLIIGDSISIGYTPHVKAMLEGKAEVVHNPGNAAHSSNGWVRVNEWIGKEKWAAIHFNFGLHDLRRMEDGKHQVVLEQYELNLDRIAAILVKTGARVTYATTTPVPKGELSPRRDRGDDILYNQAAVRVMKKHGIPVVDLWSYVRPNEDKLLPKPNVHFLKEGYEELARQVALEIEKQWKQ
ncbi:MAG: SGNH/GDSL hydrolase family protein [Acidobacteria bacterium]|nr:SGNH/GDSL hydrolase family protein [Acidobacteriota bacterium]